MHIEDEERLRHMLDAAREALEFARGRSRRDLNADRQFALALVKEIEINGEAAYRMSADLKSQFLEIPWNDIANMRHRLVHAYFQINLDIVWDSVTRGLPPLVGVLERILPPLPNE